MNIFFLDKNPRKAAQMLCDKHIPKMLLESVQILCTISHLRGVPAPYKQTHENHPCVKWANSRAANYLWLFEHTNAISIEYTRRYKKTHKSLEVLSWVTWAGAWPHDIGDSHLMDSPAQAMPEQYQAEQTIEGAVKAYRAYYIGEKARFTKWEKGTPAPEWWTK